MLHSLLKNASVNLNEELATFGPYQIYGIARLGARKTAWKSAELPKVGETFWAKVTCVNQKGDFFLEDVCSQPELDCIRNELTAKYSGSLPAEADMHCTPGDLCIAK